MSTPRIKPGESVRWRTYPDAGAGPIYEGVVVAFIPAGERIGESARQQMKGLDFVFLLAKLPLSAAKPKTRARYVVRCPVNAKPQNVSYRAVSASLLERQNPDAGREP